MTKEDDRILFDLLASLKSGKVSIHFNQDETLEVKVSGNDISVNLEEPASHGEGLVNLHTRLTELRLLRGLSKFLHGSSIRLEVYRNRQKIISMGRGINSLLGNEKVHFLNLLRSRKS